MDIRKLQRAIVDGLEDVKAQNIVVFNTEQLSPLFERVIVASGTSNRQTKALASSVRETVKSRGMDVLRTEGEDNGEWIIVDCGAAVAHIMQPAIRDYYRLEEIWGGKPVHVKLGSQVRTLPKASEPAEAGAATTSAKPASKAARSTAKKAGSQATAKATRGGASAKKAASRATASDAPPRRKAAAGPNAARAAATGVAAKKTTRRPSTAASSRPAAGAVAGRRAAPASKTTAGRPAAKRRAPR